VQDLGLFPSEDDPTVWTYLPKQNAIWQTFGNNVTIYDPKTQKAVPTNLQGGFTTGDYKLRYYLANGEPFFKETHDPQNPTTPTPTQLKPPRFTLAPGEVVRFRMLNASSDNYMPIAVEGHDLHLLALDGVNFPKVRTIAPTPINTDPKNEGQIQLAPANRAEFMIKGSATPGIYRIVQLQQQQQFLFSAQKTIAEIEVTTGTPLNMALPTALPTPTREYPLIKPSEVQNLRVIYFADQFPGTQNPYVGIDFLLNGQQYDVEQVNYVANLNGVEEWRLVVGDSQHGGTEGHPFHIHVNSFEVISVNGKPVEPGTIKDTIWIPAESTVVIRIRFKEFIGKAVFHCHILPHEDTGMMQNFLIKKRDQPFPPSIFDPPMHPRLRPLLKMAVPHRM
jgi:suppressor of ftsI